MRAMRPPRGVMPLRSPTAMALVSAWPLGFSNRATHFRAHWCRRAWRRLPEHSSCSGLIICTSRVLQETHALAIAHPVSSWKWVSMSQAGYVGLAGVCWGREGHESYKQRLSASGPTIGAVSISRLGYSSMHRYVRRTPGGEKRSRRCRQYRRG